MKIADRLQLDPAQEVERSANRIRQILSRDLKHQIMEAEKMLTQIDVKKLPS